MSQLNSLLTGQPNEKDHKAVEVRLIALGEEFQHARTDAARADLRHEYRRLHRRWLGIKPAPTSGGTR